MASKRKTTVQLGWAIRAKRGDEGRLRRLQDAIHETIAAAGFEVAEPTCAFETHDCPSAATWLRLAEGRPE